MHKRDPRTRNPAKRGPRKRDQASVCSRSPAGLERGLQAASRARALRAYDPANLARVSAERPVRLKLGGSPGSFASGVSSAIVWSNSSSRKTDHIQTQARLQGTMQ